MSGVSSARLLASHGAPPLPSSLVSLLLLNLLRLGHHRFDKCSQPLSVVGDHGTFSVGGPYGQGGSRDSSLLELLFLHVPGVGGE